MYGNVVEQILKDAPHPLGNEVFTTIILHANLMNDVLTQRSVTAALYFFNTTSGDWYSKRQATVENASYESGFVVATTAAEQIIEIRQTLRYLNHTCLETTHYCHKCDHSPFSFE